MNYLIKCSKLNIKKVLIVAISIILIILIIVFLVFSKSTKLEQKKYGETFGDNKVFYSASREVQVTIPKGYEIKQFNTLR